MKNFMTQILQIVDKHRTTFGAIILGLMFFDVLKGETPIQIFANGIVTIVGMFFGLCAAIAVSNMVKKQ